MHSMHWLRLECIVALEKISKTKSTDTKYRYLVDMIEILLRSRWIFLAAKERRRFLIKVGFDDVSVDIIMKKLIRNTDGENNGIREIAASG